jgi:hypothetical protein
VSARAFGRITDRTFVEVDIVMEREKVGRVSR